MRYSLKSKDMQKKTGDKQYNNQSTNVDKLPAAKTIEL